MKLNVEINLTESQIELLKKIQLAECYEEMLDEEDEDLQFMCEIGVTESILGEQFFITNLGEAYLKNLK
jgi:3-deoxy-D-arabino-heptulosonate 7-phosphate (DAHP) synthase class II